MASKISPTAPLLLGSGSPRRRELLTQVGLPIVVRPVAVDESVGHGEEADAYLARVVADKGRAAAVALAEGAYAACLVADTVVLSEGRILGKPSDDRESAAMIRALAGREHVVATRFELAAADGERVVETVTTRVWFRPLADAQVERYVATGEGRDKAGAYAIQGIGALLVERIEGDYANVVGLPLCAVIRAMETLELIDACPIV